MTSQSTGQFNLIDIVVLAFYYLFTCFLFLGLFGYFSRLAVCLVLLILLLAVFLIRKHISFDKNYLWFFIIVPVVALGFAFLRGFFTGDAYQLWLPAARDLVRTGYLPGFAVNYFFSRMPLLSILFGATFALAGSFNELLCIWISLFFSSLTLILIYHWAKEKGLDRKFLFFIPFLFLTNIIVIFFGSWNLLQESIILFFATTFFYYYEKYLAGYDKKYLILLIISFVLACASKISGFFLFLIIAWAFVRDKNKKEFLSYLFFFSVPIIFWLARNYLIFDNPFYPILSNIFKGRYDITNQQYYSFHALPVYLTGIWSKYWWVIRKYLWISFPFIILSLYGFIKERRYDYLLTVGLFFIVKEAFLFVPSESSVRYFYLFLGVFLVYAMLGLAKLKSRWLISLLVILAILGLLMVPITDSSSQFISLFENRLSFFGRLFNILQTYWYLALLALAPLAYKASQKDDIKLFLIFFYCLFILYLRFVANKSWLNTWPFIVLSLLLFIVFVFKERIGYLKQIIITIIILTIFVNSWMLGAVYYLHQGKFSFPVDHLWSESKWADKTLAQTVAPGQKDFHLLISAQTGYFSWYTDYQFVQLFSREFWNKLVDYDSWMDSQALWQMLKDNKIKYLIKNETSFGYYPEQYEKFFNKVEESEQIQLIAQKDNLYFIWQVYEN